MSKRIRAGECLQHKWMTVGAGIVTTPIVTPKEEVAMVLKRDYRYIFRVGILAVRFIHRLKNLKYLKQSVDRSELRKRPFRNREVVPTKSLMQKFFRFVTKRKLRRLLSTGTG